MVRAMWNGAVIAESDDTVVVDGYHYFPIASVDQRLLVPSDHTSMCGWKGTATYFTVRVAGEDNRDAAWQYATPSAAAVAVTGRIAFWRGVEVVDDHTIARAERRRLRGWRRRPADTSAASELDEPGAGPIADLTDATFEAATEGHFTLVDFWAPWCAPCRAFHPVFDALARAYTSEAAFARCDVDASPQIAADLMISAIPTVVLLDHAGNEVERITGVPTSQQLRALLAHTHADPEGPSRERDRDVASDPAPAALRGNT